MHKFARCRHRSGPFQTHPFGP